MILALSMLPVAVIACLTTWPTEYASATSALTPDAVPPYCAMYSVTIFWLPALCNAGYQPFGHHHPGGVARAHRAG